MKIQCGIVHTYLYIDFPSNQIIILIIIFEANPTHKSCQTSEIIERWNIIFFHEIIYYNSQ